RPRRGRTRSARRGTRRRAPLPTISRSRGARATAERAGTRARTRSTRPRRSKSLSRDRILVERPLRPILQYPRERESPDREQRDRSAPERPRGRLQRRTVDDELAVPRDEELDDFLVSVTFRHLLMHLAAQVRGDRRIGVRDARVQALRTADLAQQRAIALVHDRIVEAVLGLDRERERRRAQQHEPCDQL